MKITIIGLAGSGKTTLAERIGNKLDISHLHLDLLWVESGGLKSFNQVDSPEKDQIRKRFKKKVIEAIDRPNWVSDGFYSRVQPLIANRADVVIYLNIPTWRRVLNHMVRTFKVKRHLRVGLLNDIKFFPEIIKRQKKYQPRFDKILKDYGDKVVTINNYRDLENFVNNLKRD